MSRQAAWERFHNDVPNFRQQVKADARALRERQRKEWDEFKEKVRGRAKAHDRRSR